MAKNTMGRFVDFDDTRAPAPHPAGYNPALLAEIDRQLPRDGLAVEPFAGTGRGLQLATFERYIHAVELEPEWAAQAPWTPYGEMHVGDALQLAFPDDYFDMAFTSPTYGNRIADTFKDHRTANGWKRQTYTHSLGRPLSAHNSGALQWGSAYRSFHFQAWTELRRVLRPGGTFVLNIKDHIRDGAVQPVAAWHARALELLGFQGVEAVQVPCVGRRYGANYDKRVEFEWVARFALLTQPLWSTLPAELQAPRGKRWNPSGPSYLSEEYAIWPPKSSL